MSERTRGFGGGSSSTVGAVLWLFCFQYFVGEQIARVGWDRGAAAGVYSMARNYISDLGAVRCGAVLHRSGVICSPWHGLMNGSFILQGCLIFAGSLLVRRLFPRGQLCGVGLWVIAVSGLGVLAVGLAPEDVNLAVHGVGALVHFLGANVGMVLVGAGLLTARGSGGWWEGEAVRGLTIFAGVLGLAGTLIFLSGNDAGLGTGWIERVAAYPLPLWLTGMGALLLARAWPGTGGRTTLHRSE